LRSRSTRLKKYFPLVPKLPLGNAFLEALLRMGTRANLDIKAKTGIKGSVLKTSQFIKSELSN